MENEDIVSGALSRGYSIDEIADKLSTDQGLDPAEIRARGYNSNEILGKLGYQVPQPAAAKKEEGFFDSAVSAIKNTFSTPDQNKSVMDSLDQGGPGKLGMLSPEYVEKVRALPIDKQIELGKTDPQAAKVAVDTQDLMKSTKEKPMSRKVLFGRVDNAFTDKHLQDVNYQPYDGSGINPLPKPEEEANTDSMGNQYGSSNIPSEDAPYILTKEDSEYLKSLPYTIDESHKRDDLSLPTRALGTGAHEMAFLANLMGGFVVQGVKEGINAVGGNLDESNWLWDQAQKNDKAVENLSLGQGASTAEKIGFGVVKFIPDLALMAATGGESAVLQAEKVGLEAVAQQLKHGGSQMRGLAIKNATLEAKNVLDRGGSQSDAVKAATMSVMFDLGTGGVAMGSEGNLAKRFVTGIPTGAAISAGRISAMNSVLPANQQQEYDPSELLVGGITQGILHGAMGGKARERMPTREELGYAGARKAEANLPDSASPLAKLKAATDESHLSELQAAKQQIINKAKSEAAVAKISQAASVDEAIASANEAVNTVPVRLPVSQELADGSNVILQNRDRRGAGSVEQMNSIAAAPDYGRLSVSRDFTNGAPVVFADSALPETAVIGKESYATTADGRRIPVQYAAVEASSLLASNRADGTPNLDYVGNVDGKLRAIAGNGRIAGLQEAYARGTTEAYKNELMADGDHGIDPAAIAQMKEPVLVRVMPKNEVTADIGDVSNTTGTAALSPIEQAANDARRVDVSALQFDDNGLSRESVQQFVNSMPMAERAGLMNPDGTVTRQAEDRLMAAVFHEAYGNEELVKLYAQAVDPESKTVLNALAIAAPKLVQLKNAGEFDIRDVISEAAQISVNAKRNGVKLVDWIQNADFTRNPETVAIVQFMAENSRSAKRIGEGISDLADAMLAAHNSESMGSMFDDLASVSRGDVLKQFEGKYVKSENQTDSIDTGRSINDVVNPEQAAAERTSEVGPDANEVGRQELKLESETADQARARITEQEQQAKAKADEQSRLDAQDKQSRIDREIAARQDASAENFELGQSAEDSLSGQQDIFKSTVEPQAFESKTAANYFKVKNGINGIPKQTELGWQFDPSRELTEADKRESVIATKALNAALAEGDDPARPLLKAPNQNFALARELGKLFGFKVHFIDQNGTFDGVAHNGNAFLSSSMKHPVIAIAGHEMLHLMEKANRALSNKFRTAVAQYLKDGVIDARQLREGDLAGRDVSRSEAAGETFADINGAMFLDPKFWRELRDADRNLFRQAAYTLMEVLSKANKVLTGSRFDVSQFVTDVDAVRKIIVDTWTEHNQVKDLERATNDNRPEFSREKRDARDRAVRAKDEYEKLDALARTGKASDADLDNYFEVSLKMGEAKEDLAKELANTADDMFAFYADTGYGQVFVNRSAKGDGGYQVTYTNKAGEPISDTFHKTKEAALSQFVKESDPSSIREFDPDSHLNFSRKSTIEVDGVDRPTKNSNGKPIAETEEGIKNFWRWFGNSKVVDADGNPLVVFHGSESKFDAFDKSKMTNARLGKGFYFSTNIETAKSYGENVISAYLNIDRLYDTKTRKFSGDGKSEGMEYSPSPNKERWFIVDSPKQIKSATGNNGEFNADSADIRFSRKDKAERDSKYLDLVKSGNLEEAQKLVDQAALEAGYITKNDYRMAHQAPNSDGGTSIAGIRESGLVPDDYWTHPHWYQSTPEERQAFSSVMSAMRRLDARKEEGKSGDSVGLFVYRAVPKDVKDGSIRNGDWVSPSREYAQLEGQSIPGGYKIISQNVLLKNLYWDGNSIAELGVDDGKAYGYKNTKNNKKLVDVVTRDDNGDVIPLSKRFNSRSDDVRYSRKDPDTWYYSQLSKSVEEAPDRVFGAPKQFAAWLDSNSAKLGIKKDELQWSGVSDWLKLQTGKVSKQDVLDYLRSGGVKVEETLKGGGAVRRAEQRLKEFEQDRKNFIDEYSKRAEESGGNRVEVSTALKVIAKDPFNEAAWKIVGKHDGNGLDPNVMHDLSDQIEYAKREIEIVKNTNQDDTKYKDYQLPGGDNYRELLLTLPDTKGDLLTELLNKRSALEEPYMAQGKDLPESVMPEWRSLNNQISEVRNNKQKEYKSSHWDEKNILAHVRFNDRTDVDGNKVLFIEELQSDWGQDGLKKGFDQPKKYSMTPEERAEFVALLKIPEAQLSPEQNQRLDYLDDLDNKISDERKQVPSAPFVTKTESWLQLGIKRMIAYAVEHGYSKVAFVNGEQSADRYNLSKQVGGVYYTRDGGIPGEGTLIAMPVGKTINDAGARAVIEKDGVKESEIENYVGKDVARKLLESEPDKNGFHFVEGGDLKVGGEGMKAFYDKIVPQNINDVLKKIGGGKIEQVDFSTKNDKHFPTRDFDPATVRVQESFGMFSVVDDKGTIKTFSDKSDAESYIANNAKTNQIGFTITDAMRQKVDDGLPLFSRKAKQNKSDLVDEANKPEPVKSPESLKEKLSSILKVPAKIFKSTIDEPMKLIAPMSTGSDDAKVIATKFADAERRARFQWNRFDEIITKEFSKEQQEKMWNAADQENNLRREGRTSDTEGLNSLEPREREVVEFLHDYSEMLWDKAVKNGMVDSDGVHYWTPRKIMLIDENGRLSPLKKQEAREFSKDARNLRTSASSMKSRKYETTEEAEAAAQAYAEDGKKAVVVRNIRTMPMAMAELERAIAGRDLVNQIKAMGEISGRELVAKGMAGNPDFFTMDHPALRKAKPVFVEDPETGKMRAKLDEDGMPVMERTPIFISKEFEGPIKAVLHTQTGEIYNTLMELKSKSMGVIMMSPAIHFAVEWGRSFPAMLSSVSAADAAKNAASLGAYTYFVGNKAKKDSALMRNFIDHGLVPLGDRGMNADISGIADGKTMEVGKSWTAKGLGKIADVISPKAGDAVRGAVDKAGDFWHGTLLWNRIADLQVGLAVTMKSSLMNKGVDEYTATTLAAHWANRYAGALPPEAMGQAARQVANLAMFSRSFTLGNMGLMKDMVNGLPPNRQAMIKMAAREAAKALEKSDAEIDKIGDKTLRDAKRVARTKAIQSVALDIALMYLVNAAAQAYFENEEQKKDWKYQVDKFGERWSDLKKKALEDPVSVMMHPFHSLESLTPQGHNMEGKRERIRVGDDKDGNTIYMRLPFGKVGEELLAYTSPGEASKLMANKRSPMLSGAFESLSNQDHWGHKIYDEHDNTMKQAAKAAWHFMKAQTPWDQLVAMKEVASGHGDEMDTKKAFGPFSGLTYSKVTGGDVLAQEYKAQRDFQDRKVAAMPDARHALKEGNDDEAWKILEDTGMTPKEIGQTIAKIKNPGRPMPANAFKKVYQHATDEQKAVIDELRGR